MTDPINLRVWLASLDPAVMDFATFGLLALEGAGVPGIPGVIPMVAQVASIDAGHTTLGAAVSWGVAGNFVGSVAGYAAGRWGQRFIPARVLRHLRSDRVGRLLSQYGGPLIIASRTVGTLRTPVTILAGTSHYPFWPYVFYSLLGSLIHVGVWQTVLWKFGPAMLPVLEKRGGQVMLLALLLGLAFLAWRWWAQRRTDSARGTG